MEMTATSIYGTAPVNIGMVPAQTAMSATDTMTGGMGGTLRTVLSPSNPLFWFGVILVVTTGAAGIAGSVRLGRSKIAANVGKA